MSHEFRVRWQREGRNPTYRIYQSWNAAVGKCQSVQAIDAIKGETERFADMPDLVGPPELQVREVGEWHRHDYQPTMPESARETMREHIFCQYGEGAPRDQPSGEVTF